jgi:apolipoprotein N-acyltransferase
VDAGREDVLLREGVALERLICFEAIFPDLARGRRRAGRALAREHHERRVVRQRRALHQHAAMAMFRAAENHVPDRRAARTRGSPSSSTRTAA